MRRLFAWLRRRAPLPLAVALGAVAGLAGAAVAAPEVGAAWQAHVVPAFSRLLGTLVFC